MYDDDDDGYNMYLSISIKLVAMMEVKGQNKYHLHVDAS